MAAVSSSPSLRSKIACVAFTLTALVLCFSGPRLTDNRVVLTLLPLFSGICFSVAGVWVKITFGIRGKKALMAALLTLLWGALVFFALTETDERVKRGVMVLSVLMLIPLTGGVFHADLSANMRRAFYGLPLLGLWSIELLGMSWAAAYGQPFSFAIALGIAPLPIGLTIAYVWGWRKWSRSAAPGT